MAEEGAHVIAVDPNADQITAGQLAKFTGLGGRYVKGTASDIGSQSADRVVQYFPYSRRFAGHGTVEALDQASRIVRPNGVITFVTENQETANFLTTQGACIDNTEVVRVVSTAGQAAPGATGAGVPGMSPTLKVFLVNIYTY